MSMGFQPFAFSSGKPLSHRIRPLKNVLPNRQAKPPRLRLA